MRETSMPLVTSGARRGYGYRQPGGAYFAVPRGRGARPVEALLIDSPVVIDDSARLELASAGLTLIERDGVAPFPIPQIEIVADQLAPACECH